jgi:tRNA synthetases class I (R)
VHGNENVSSHLPMTGNLFDYVEDVSARDGGSSSWTARTPRRPEEQFDLMMLPRVPQWQEDADSREALRRIEREPWVESVIASGDVIHVRLDDSWIDTTGAALEAGGSAEAGLADLGAGKHVAVQFWDANATKALHVGHLRNLAIGNALAAALAQAGSQVECRSLISDAGRSMGEAMAGVIGSGRGAHELSDDEKSDHFVGVCYADYVSSLGSFAGRELEDSEDSFERELVPRADTADELLKRVLAGDREALEVWYRTRAWVIAGQRKTLARLGVAFDRVFFESDFLAEAAELIAKGMSDGKLHRRTDGAIVYETELEEFEELPLVRSDGLTTQHLRAVAYWITVAEELGETTSVQVCGTEWVGHASCINRLMTDFSLNGNGAANSNGLYERVWPHTYVVRGGHGSMMPISDGEGSGNGAAARSDGRDVLTRPVHPRHDIFHGMVARQKRAMTSGEGALLVDEVVDWVDEQIDSDPDRREVRRRHPSPERIAGQIALGYFLPSQVTPRIDFEPEKLLCDDESLGWDLVRARARRGSSAVSSGKPADDPAYRFAVVQSELYRRHLRLAVNRFDLRPLALYLKHLTRWHLESEQSEHTERVVQTLLDRSARGLGLEGAR